ncbi:MAG: hypothetical protein ACHQRO_04975, partial [Vicinamibacteria bacterium]
PSHPEIKTPGTSDKPGTVEKLCGTAKGSDPSADPPGWDQILAAQLTTKGDGRTDFWVRMHIISAEVGGAGSADNLVPAPNSVNSGFRPFEHGVRDLAKAKAKGEANGKTIKNVVWMRVTVSWRSGRKFAQSISGSAGLYVWRGKTDRWVKNDAASLSTNMLVPAPELHLEQKISLNRSSGSDLAQVMDRKLANVIKENRPYGSPADFKAKVIPIAEARNAGDANAVSAILANPRVVLDEGPAPAS